MNDEALDMREEYDMQDAKRGAIVPPDPRTTRITIRIDTEVLDWFREQADQAGGGSYQARMNEALREYMQRGKERFEDILRRVIREELQATK